MGCIPSQIETSGLRTPVMTHFAFYFGKLCTCLCQLIAHGSDQLENLSYFHGHYAPFSIQNLCNLLLLSFFFLFL